MQGRRTVVTGLGAAAAMLAAPPVLRAQGLVKVDLALGAFTFAFLPILVASAAGHFKDEGVDINLVRTGGGSNTMAAALGGSSALACVPMPDVILASKKGQRLVCFAPVATEFASDALVSKAAAEKAGIKPDMSVAERLRRVKGMVLAVSSRGGGTDQMWRHMLRVGKLDADRDVTLTVVALDQMYPALKAGRIDGFNSTSPTTNLVVDEGLGVWVARPSQGEVPGLEHFLYAALVARPDYIAKNGPTLTKICRALERASKLIQSDARQCAELLSKGFMSQSTADALNAIILDQRGAFPAKLRLTEAMFQQNLEFLRNLGEDVAGVKFADVLDAQFLPA